MFNRYFFASGSSKIIENVTDQCDVCRALKKAPKEIFDQSTSLPAAHPGLSLAADVICRAGQKILVVRDTLTAYTTATFIPGENTSDYRDGIIICTLPMKSQISSIRVDCAPGLKSLKEDRTLQSNGIILDFGRVKNANKNPVAEKANQELELEILKVDPSGKAITAVSLTQAVHVLNTRIRKSGLSSKEMFFQRDQVSGQQLTFNDASLGSDQSKSRHKNHLASAASKGKGGSKAQIPDVSVGSIVFIKQEGSKFSPRESYIVVDIPNSKMAVLQKMDVNKKCFRSKTYEVPLVNIYPSVLGQLHTDATPSHLMSDPQIRTPANDFSAKSGSSSSSDDSDFEVSLPFDNSVSSRPRHPNTSW